jgi:hypothetical protein
MTMTTRSGIVCTLRFTLGSAFFHPLRVEYDCVAGVRSVTSFNPVTYPAHPAAAQDASVTIRKVLQRTGFDVSISGDHSNVPMRYAGGDSAWSDRELHDAMLAYWSNFFTDEAKWSMWILFANRREKNDACAGIMFDTSKRSQRRGMAIFDDSAYFNGPSGERDLAAWKQRMKFFSVGHEIGHLFNLRHPEGKGRSWIAARSPGGPRSFMDNPAFFERGRDAFFSGFSYRFSDEELFFIRHAPDEYVKMGNRAWMVNPELSLPAKRKKDRFSLVVRTGRETDAFSFMEPVVLECKLKNISGKELAVDVSDHVLTQTMSFWIQGAAGTGWTLLRPFSHSEYFTAKGTLCPGRSFFSSVFISVGADGWIIMEPGSYSITACWHSSDGPVWSDALTIHIDRPGSRALEILAQDYFSEDVGRVLAFDGSTVLMEANNCLQRCLEPGIPEEVALHARIALATPLKDGAKTLDFKKNGHGSSYVSTVITTKSSPEQHKKELENALFTKPLFAASTLGNIAYKLYVDDFSHWLLKNNLDDEACTAQERLYTTFLQRGIENKGVLETIRDKITAIKSKEIAVS